MPLEERGNRHMMLNGVMNNFGIDKNTNRIETL
jgi:hypothetical protein